MGIITAHSGCDGTEDNSLEFVTYALRSEAGCLEVDVRKGQDGDLILSHDDNGGEGVFLRNVFERMAQVPEKMINCDLKERDLEIPVYRMACHFHMEERLIYSGEVDPVHLEENKKNFEKARIFLNIENLYPDIYKEEEQDRERKLKETIEKAASLPVTCINAEYHILTDEIITFIKGKGLGCSAWTVNDEKELKRLMIRKAENITTRNLKGAILVKKEMEL